jgi:hypothetical protein
VQFQSNQAFVDWLRSIELGQQMAGCSEGIQMEQPHLRNYLMLDMAPMVVPSILCF